MERGIPGGEIFNYSCLLTWLYTWPDLCVRPDIRAMMEHRPYCPFPKTARQFDDLTVLSSALHFVLRLSVEGRLRPEGSKVEGRAVPT
jgi:hypothetical protein